MTIFSENASMRPRRKSLGYIDTMASLFAKKNGFNEAEA